MCIFIIKNGKRVVALALVPFIAINIYAGSKFFKRNEATKIGKKSSTIEMLDRTDYRTITLASDEKEVEQIVVKTKEEENVFEKLQQIFLSSNKEVNEILDSADAKGELYASALYVKLQSAGLSDDIIKKELDNILSYSLTFTDMDEATWLSLFGHLVGTISEYENVMDYYYPLASFVHKNECSLAHVGHEFDESRLTCATLEEMNEKAFSNLPCNDYLIDMIMVSGDEKVINQYNKIINAGVNFNDALVELNSIYELSQIPMCIDEDVWNELFKNLLTTVGEYDNVFEVYGELACYIHELSCDFEHYTDEYGINVCEGLKLVYTYEN